MIFITTGSQKFQFDRLLKAIDELVAKGSIQEETFAQTGYSDYIPQHYAYSKFLNREEFAAKIEKADIVITHGGTGVIINAVKKRKKVLAVPRLAKFQEHVDNHQEQLLKEFDEMKLICVCYDVAEMADKLEEVRGTNYLEYKSNTANMIADIEAFLGECQ